MLRMACAPWRYTRPLQRETCNAGVKPPHCIHCPYTLPEWDKSKSAAGLDKPGLYSWNLHILPKHAGIPACACILVAENACRPPPSTRSHFPVPGIEQHRTSLPVLLGDGILDAQPVRPTEPAHEYEVGTYMLRHVDTTCSKYYIRMQ